MRTPARVALASIALSASFGLGACGPVDDLRDALSQMLGKSPAVREPVVVGNEPEAAPAPPPERPLKKPASTKTAPEPGLDRACKACRLRAASRIRARPAACASRICAGRAAHALA